jgi:TRAP-type C4-dicarboxylate transport system permease small subunit
VIRSISKKILQGAAGISTILVLILPIAIIADVLSRSLFNKPIAAVFEGTQYAMLWIPLLAAPLITLANEHIVVDLIDGLFNRKHGALIRTVIQISSAAVSLVAVVVLAIMAWDSVIAAIEAGTRMTTTLRPPRWIIQSILPVSMTLTAVVFGLLLTTAAGKTIQRKRSAAEAAGEK